MSSLRSNPLRLLRGFSEHVRCGAYVWRERVVRVRERGKRREGAVQRGRSTMRA